MAGITCMTQTCETRLAPLCFEYHERNASYTSTTRTLIIASSTPAAIYLPLSRILRHHSPPKYSTIVIIASLSPTTVIHSSGLGTISDAGIAHPIAPCTKRQRISTIAEKEETEARLPCTEKEPWGQENFGSTSREGTKISEPLTYCTFANSPRGQACILISNAQSLSPSSICIRRELTFAMILIHIIAVGSKGFNQDS